MVDDLIIYLKTTDTCQLNCRHCYTYGNKGVKGFFNPTPTISFLQRLHTFKPQISNGSITFHGGEPFLCPTELMFEVWDQTKYLWPNLWWSIQSNMTFEMTDDRLHFLDRICQKTWGTSWDYGIRWSHPKQEQMWEKNIRELAQDNHNITVIISLTQNLLNDIEPIELIDKMAKLGIKHINFERITANGNAQTNQEASLVPSNLALDRWFLKMWDQSVEHKSYEYIDNLFFNSILSSKVYQTFSGCRCRQCEQKVFTINANGSVGGCPNTAVDAPFAHINDPIEHLFFNEGRLCNIQKESLRPKACYQCEVYNLCNGDCHQLGWEDQICAAPKSLMTSIKKSNDMKLFKSFLNGFQGQE